MPLGGITSQRIVRLLAAVLILSSLASCGLDTDQLINDMNEQLENEGEIYYDPNCADEDGDGWCD